jgi:formylglycine-generating enzyme required for sulfatase activity
MLRSELFISYSHKDLRWLEQLRTHLKPLERDYNLQRWDDSRIKPGDQWLVEIEQALARAAVALLLVSPDFVASDFIDRKEMPSLLDAARNQGLTILWVPLRPISLRLFPQIEQYQAVFSPDRTLADMTAVEQDRVLAKISETIFDTIDKTKQHQALKQQDNLQKVEKDRLELLKAQSAAHADDAQRWRAEAQRLAQEKEALRLQVEASTPPEPWTLDQILPPFAPGPALIRISADRGALVRVGNEWQKKTERMTVAGYEQELAPGLAITMVQIPAGSFEMGSPASEAERLSSEGPQHRVQLESFFLGQTPVTQAQWKEVASWPRVELELNPDPARFKGANRPVEQVSWEEAIEFCRRLSQRSKMNYTLPSEAQWEYACRGGTTTPFAFGDTLTSDLANYDGNFIYEAGPKGQYRKRTTEVGHFPANAWGLQDMHGNVWEWCLDHWHDDYRMAPSDGSAWVDEGDSDRRLLRGGSWCSYPGGCRSAFRNRRPLDSRLHSGGFRLCRFPPGLAS